MSDMKLHEGVGQRGPTGYLPKTSVLSTQNADANSAAASNLPRKSHPQYDFGLMPLLVY